MNVLGIRFAVAGHPLVTGILAGVAAVAWLVLAYGVPASLLLARSGDSAVGDVNGTWLLWVVATPSLSLAAPALVSAWPSRSGPLAPVAVGLWGIGLVLYLLLVSLILLRWRTAPVTPRALTPPYWIAFMEPLSRFMLWVALAAWVAASAALVARTWDASGLRAKVSWW